MAQTRFNFTGIVSLPKADAKRPFVKEMVKNIQAELPEAIKKYSYEIKDDEFIVIDDCLCVSEESYKGWKYLLLLESIAIALIMFILVIVGTIYVGIKWFVLFLLLGCVGFMMIVAFLGVHRSEVDTL